MGILKSPPALEDVYERNFQTLIRAAEEDDLVLMSCLDRATGEPRAVICAHFTDDEGLECFVPIAKLFDGNPYEEMIPPEERTDEQEPHST